jgi:hypothetical protein
MSSAPRLGTRRGLLVCSAGRTGEITYGSILSSLQLVNKNRCFIHSLPIPSRDDIVNSPAERGSEIPSGRQSPGHIDDPSDELEKELAGTHISPMMS